MLPKFACPACPACTVFFSALSGSVSSGATPIVEKLAPLVAEGINAGLLGRKIVFGDSQEIPGLFDDFPNFIGTKPCDFIIIAQYAPSKSSYQQFVIFCVEDSCFDEMLCKQSVHCAMFLEA